MNEASSEPKSREVRPAMEVLGRLRNGRVVEELADAINNVVGGVIATGKGGTVTLKITIAKVDSTPNGVVVKGEVSDKPPEPTKATDVFFADDANNLFVNNPRQKDLFGSRPRPAPVAGKDFDQDTGEVANT